MLTRHDVEWARRNELQILQGRRCAHGDFHFVKRTLASRDPFTNEPSWTTANEYARPFIRSVGTGSGAEYERMRYMLPEGIIEEGDIIAIIDWRKPIETDEPTTVGNSQYVNAVYDGVTYRIKYAREEGLGTAVRARTILILARETT